MKPCFGYIRVSTQKQGEGVSLEAQKDAITAFASRNNLSIVEWFEEKETAAKSGRPVFARMIKELNRGKASGLITHKIDRSARNLRDYLAITELSDAGVDVYFATESLDFRSRGGRLTADIQAVIAADYIRNLREETIKGINGRLKQGLYPFRAPIGYLDNGAGKPKTPDPRKAPLIQEMFDLYASGQHSFASLQVEITRRGLRNLNGKPLSLCGVETILKNPFYTGLIVIARTGRTYDGIHEPIISHRLFRAVQDRKAGRKGPQVTRHNHLYRRLFRCGSCAGPMIGERQKGHVYYRCHLSGCDSGSIREEALEGRIIDELARLQLTPAMASDLEAEWGSETVDAELVAKRAAIELQIADDEQRLSRLTDLLVDELINQATYRTKEQELKLRLAERREQLAELPDVETVARERRDFLELMKSLVSLYIMADAAERRVLVENCFSNRTVIKKNVELKPYYWLQVGRNDLSTLASAPERGNDRTACHRTEDTQPSQLKIILDIYHDMNKQEKLVDRRKACLLDRLFGIH